MIGTVAVACGGGSAGGGSSTPLQPQREPSGPADMAAMRALLARYAPRGHAIVTAYETLPTTFEMLGGPVTITSTASFDKYFPDGNLEHVTRYMDTGVHEVTHGYIGRMAFQMLSERKTSYRALAIPVDAEVPHLVRVPEVYPSIEMLATFPADARGLRFVHYIDTPDEPLLATQQLGLYGMMDEWSAYYQGARTTVEMWPWVRDEVGNDQWSLINYAVQLDDSITPHAEFKLYILHYLLYAREHHPEVYRAAMANTELKAAFADLDRAYGALVASIAELEPVMLETARDRGAPVSKRDGVLYIGSSGQRPENAVVYRAVLAHLAETPYQDLLAELR
jgi:hypothetical protein